MLGINRIKPKLSKILFLGWIILSLSNTGLRAQNQTTIAGIVLNNVNKETIPLASVAVYDQQNLLVTGNITSATGRFTIAGLSSGKYTVVVSFIGFHPKTISILIGQLNKNYDLGRIELTPSSTEMEEISIAGERSTLSRELDRKSFNISDAIAHSGGSVMDAMKALPGVTFDQNGKIILRGSDKVIVLMDGKQSSLTGFGNQKGLASIPAANIERIEIINNPSAKYDAAGMAGVVNIIYKKDQKSGLHGSVGFIGGLGVLMKAKDDVPTDLGSFKNTPKTIPSLDLNYNKEKLSLFLQSELMLLKKLPNNEFTTRTYDDGRIIASQVPENRRQVHTINKAGIDYRFDDRNTLSFSGIYDWEKHIDTAQVAYVDLSTNQRNRYITWHEEEITGYMNYLLNYEHKFSQPGHVLRSNVQFTKGWEDETYYINDSSAIRVERDVTGILATEYTTSLGIDYSKPLKSGRIEVGIKNQIRNLPVEYSQIRGEKSILYPGLGSWTKWGESIYAGYGNWVYERVKFDIEAGVRAEYTTVFYDMDEQNTYYQQNDAYDYFKLFPNVRLSYKFNDYNRISVFYNGRIDRPGEPELRMYSKSDDHEIVKVGNPFLRPQLSQSAEIGYKTNWESGSVFLSGYYRFIQEPYMRVYTQDTSRIQYDVILKSYANTGEAVNRGIEIIFDQKLHKLWKLSGSLNMYQNIISPYEGTLYFPYEHNFSIEETRDNSWNFKLINTIELSDDTHIQVTGLYFAPKNIPQGKELARSSIDIGIRKMVCNGNGELSLSVSDMLNQYGIRQEIQGDGFNVLYENYYETQFISLGIKYKF